MAGSAQKFLSTHAVVYNTFNVLRHLISAQTHRALRAAAMTTWRNAVAEAVGNDAIRHVAPQGDEQLASQGDDHDFPDPPSHCATFCA